jgi:hypothetical protein
MDESALQFEDIAALAGKLSPQQKILLVEKVMASLKEDLSLTEKKPRRSLYGLWPDVSISAEEIDEARREMWANFPREDI